MNDASKPWGMLAAAVVVALVLVFLVWAISESGVLRNARLAPGEVPEQYVDYVLEAGTECPRLGITAPVMAAQVHAESSWDPEAVSRAGAQGLAQFMPGTWATWGTDYDQDGTSSPFDPQDAIGSQGDYMCYLIERMDELRQQGVISGDPLDLTLAAYNAGPGNVERYGGVPPFPETEGYIATIRELIPQYSENPSMSGE